MKRATAPNFHPRRTWPGLLQPLRLTSTFTLVVTLLLLPTLSADAGEREKARGLVESMAAGVFAAAWPTATYRESTLLAVEPARQGFDIQIRLIGTSAFGNGELRLDLLFEIRNGGLSDIRVLRHNALLSPPFATLDTLAELVAEMAEENQARQRPSPTPLTIDAPTSYKISCILNRTSGELHFSVRWGTLGSWEQSSLKPGWHYWFNHSASFSEKLYIRFDHDIAAGFQEKSYWLESKVSSTRSCDVAKQYEFNWTGRLLDLTSIN